MVYEGKEIEAIQVYDSTDNDRVIATISDTKLDTVNGYKVRIIPHIEENCCE